MYSAVNLSGYFSFKTSLQPDIEEVGKFGVVEQSSEWRIGDDEIVGIAIHATKIT